MKASLVLGLVASFCIIGVYSVSGEAQAYSVGRCHLHLQHVTPGQQVTVSNESDAGSVMTLN